MSEEAKTVEVEGKQAVPTTMEVIVTMDLQTGNVNVRTNAMVVSALGLLEMAKTALQDNNKRVAAMEAMKKAAGGIIPAGKDAIGNLEKVGAIVRPS
jgi:hypothetical protein